MIGRGGKRAPRGVHAMAHGTAGGAAEPRGRVARGVAAAALQLAVGELVAAVLPGKCSPLGGLGKALIDPPAR